MKLHEKLTSGKPGYHANYVQNATDKIAEALDNLEMAATADLKILAQMVVSDKTLTEANKTLTEQVKHLTTTKATLMKQLGAKVGEG
mmetsp:Transcript_27394/g.80570  ORF Transcript_27394/g.80570 Transcript_27394/m.80570 type:complete len:87 (+) Transcript_27394:814-1074(+)